MNLAATSGKLMGAAIMYPSKSSALFATIFVAGSVALAAAAEIGPPPGAVLSVDKLSRIDDFFNAEDATGRMPGAIVLIQRHGKPVYLKMPGVSEIFPIGLTRLVPGFKKVGSCKHIAPPNCPHCFFGSEGPVTFGYFAPNWIQITRPCRELEIFRTGLRLYRLLHTEII